MCENLHFPHLYPRTVLKQIQRGEEGSPPLYFYHIRIHGIDKYVYTCYSQKYIPYSANKGGRI